MSDNRNRVSTDSASTAPSSRTFSVSSAASTAPSTIGSPLRRPSYAAHQSTESFDDRLMLAKHLTRKASQDAESEQFWRRRSSTASRIISGYTEVDDEDESSDDDAPIMYRAEAMHASKSSAFRSGYPVLSFAVGEHFDVVL